MSKKKSFLMSVKRSILQLPINMTPESLRNKREKLGLTMTQASSICRVPYKTWQNWENGRRPVPEHAVVFIEYMKLLKNSS